MTDKASIDDMLFFVLWCNVEGTDEKVRSEMKFFAVARSKAVDRYCLIALVFERVWHI